MGTGILNWVFAIPALFTIDLWGRRNLLLFTFPFLSMFLLWTGFSFWAQDTQLKVGMVTTGMYLFEVVRLSHSSFLSLSPILTFFPLYPIYLPAHLDLTSLPHNLLSPLTSRSSSTPPAKALSRSPTAPSVSPSTCATSACPGPRRQHGVSTSFCPLPGRVLCAHLNHRAHLGGTPRGVWFCGWRSCWVCRRRRYVLFYPLGIPTFPCFCIPPLWCY